MGLGGAIIDTVEKAATGWLSLMFPAPDAIPTDIARNAITGTAEAGANLAKGAVDSAIGAVPTVVNAAGGAVRDMYRDVTSVFKAVHVPDSFSAQLPSQPVGTGNPTEIIHS